VINRVRRRIALAGIASSILILACDGVKTCWVGDTDLEVVFAVTDAATGVGIAGAAVEVQSEGGFYEGPDEREFALTTDRKGIARRVCRKNMCYGTRSGLGLTHSFAGHLPEWRFRVVAEGYEPGARSELITPENHPRVRRVVVRRARLLVSGASETRR
jgi:hypothetical protein